MLCEICSVCMRLNGSKIKILGLKFMLLLYVEKLDFVFISVCCYKYILLYYNFLCFDGKMVIDGI